jgi:peptidoglycan/LPS O-acetylase OafA/YrhL
MPRRVAKRKKSLDLLRCVAILLVLARHYGYPNLLSTAGWSGVDLFFVLSGFLISGLLFSEYKAYGTIDLKRFWIRRAFKIYPAFYAFLFFILVLYTANGLLSSHIFSDLFFLQDYMTPIAEHGWSLGVEEKFYILLPLLLFLMIRVAKTKIDAFRAIPFVFVAIFAGCLALRVFGVLHGHPWNAIDRPAHLRMDSLFAGVTLGYYRYFRVEEFRRAGGFPLWILGVILLAPLGFWKLRTAWMDTVGLAMLLVGFSLIVLWAANRTVPDWLPFRAMAWIGRYSYSIYLWNLVVKGFFGYEETGGRLVFLPVYVGTSIAVGWFAAYLIETPFLDVRDRLFPSTGAHSPCEGTGAAL